MIKNLLPMQEMWVQSLGQGDPWRREWQPTPVFLPGESHGQRSLVGSKESDMTKKLTHTLLSKYWLSICDLCKSNGNHKRERRG